MIRENALLQYCIPFMSIQLPKMAEIFHTTVTDLENELKVLIESGRLKWRIDSFNGHLIASSRLDKDTIVDDVLQIGSTFNRNALALLLHVSMRQDGMMVKKPG